MVNGFTKFKERFHCTARTVGTCILFSKKKS